MRLYENPEYREEFITAYKSSKGNKESLRKDKVCGCFYCCHIFSPDEIDSYIDERGGTALCPYCGIDAVIGESSGFSITDEFLRSMRRYWY